MGVMEGKLMEGKLMEGKGVDVALECGTYEPAVYASL